MKYFTVCAIFKKEEPYIGDWIKYHLGIGAEHLWLYDNSSGDVTDKTADIARDVGGSQVTVYNRPGHLIQATAYMECLARQRIAQDARWILFSDIDEYLVTFAPLHEVLKSYENESAVCPHWILFGSNGLDRFDSVPVPVRFTRSQADVNPHVKSVVNPKRTGKCVTPHRFMHDVPPVDENHKPIEAYNSIPDGGTADVLYIAHYATKSREECYERRARPRADTGEYHYDVKQFFEAHDRNERENLDVLNIWNRL